MCKRGEGTEGGAGVLAGVRAMMARVYGGEEWYVHDEGGTGRIECLYERDSRGKHEVTFIVARLTASQATTGGRGEAGSATAAVRRGVRTTTAGTRMAAAREGARKGRGGGG